MNNFNELEKKIGIKFDNQELIETAFIHKSFFNENKDQEIEFNERLEFLGDAVLELVVTEHLFKNYPHKQEGELTSWRSALVKGKHLAQIAKSLDLGEHIRLSYGEEKSGGREKNYILANTLEALIGAVYLDKGIETSKKFIIDFILVNLEKILKEGLHINAKSKFQELSQEKENTTPEYKVLSEDGPDHDKIFKAGVYLEDDLIGSGEGSSKQKAEQEAALDALKNKGWE